MKPDCELLRQYAEEGDDAAFTEVVRRHVNLVYASAVRLLNGNATMAQDVTQVVFTDLARKAGGLSQHTSVAGWLHTSVRFAAANAVRSEQRRRLREQEASAMSDQTTNVHESFWLQMLPLIDEAVGQLHEPERAAVLLRFFEEKSHREVGHALGLTENAARMRVERGLEKLRAHLARHGITATVVLLAATLSAHAASAPAPAALAAAVAGQALAGATLPASSAGLAKAGLHTFWGTKAQLALAGSAALASVAAAALLFTQTGSGASMPKHASSPATPAPMVSPADVLAALQAKNAQGPDVIAAAAALASTASAAATSTAITGVNLLQTIKQPTSPLVVKNSAVIPTNDTPVADNSAPASSSASNSSSPTEAQPTAPTAAPVAADSPRSTDKITQWSPAVGGNGHYYQAVVEPNGITWTQAEAIAVQQGGHLATIASRDENDFVFGLINAQQFWTLTSDQKALLGPWIGGEHWGEATDMNYGWQWVSGGTMGFTNWAILEPRPTGDRLHYFAWGNNRLPTWDNAMAYNLMPGFIVEYDNKPGSLLSKTKSPAKPPKLAQNQSPNVPRGTSPVSPTPQRVVIVRPIASPFLPSRQLSGQRALGPIPASNGLSAQILALSSPFVRSTP